jgi:hypothetical protein
MTGEDQTLERKPRQEIVASKFDIEGHTRRLSVQLGESARSADILLVPTDFGEEHPGGYFPESTPAVLQLLRRHVPSEVAVEAAVDDDGYAEYAYRSADLILPALVIQGQQILSGVVISILADYVNSHFAKLSRSTAYVRAEVHAQAPDGQGFKVHYDGPAETFESVMTEMLNSVRDGSVRSGSDRGADS